MKLKIKKTAFLISLSLILLVTNFMSCQSTQNIDENPVSTSEAKDNFSISELEEKLPEGEGFYLSSEENIQPSQSPRNTNLDKENNLTFLTPLTEDNIFPEESFTENSAAENQTTESDGIASTDTTNTSATNTDTANTVTENLTGENIIKQNSNTTTPLKELTKQNTDTLQQKNSSDIKQADINSSKNENTVSKTQNLNSLSKEKNIDSKNKNTENTDIQDTSKTEETANSLTQLKTEEILPSREVTSREVTIKNNQYLDITYPGKGWIYLGESDENTHLRYFGRKLNSDNTSFTLRSYRPGTCVLHFYKNDALSGKFIDDYLKVTVEEERYLGNEHAISPSYADLVPPKADLSDTNEELLKKEIETEPELNIEDENKVQDGADSKTALSSSNARDSLSSDYSSFIQGESKKADTEKTTSVKENAEDSDVSNLLEKAKKAYDEKNYEDALNYLNQFFTLADSRIDEGLYLQGQVLEAPSNVKNIRSALNTYETLVRQYPQSKLWRKANERIIYIKRFYFKIR